MSLLYQIAYINDIVQDCNNSIADAPELLQSCTKPSISVQNFPALFSAVKWGPTVNGLSKSLNGSFITGFDVLVQLEVLGSQSLSDEWLNLMTHRAINLMWSYHNTVSFLKVHTTGELSGAFQCIIYAGRERQCKILHIIQTLFPYTSVFTK